MFIAVEMETVKTGILVKDVKIERCKQEKHSGGTDYNEQQYCNPAEQAQKG